MPLTLRPLLQHVRRLAVPVAAIAEPDAVLLDRFLGRRDEDAFAALVARHGPMVLRLCRRVLGDRHAAEDVFQACFLVLARRAASIRCKDTLAAWLHAVALRLALRARALGSHQPAPLSGEPMEPADGHADPLAALTARDLLVAMDEEIGRLPERYRLPVLLCCIEGLSQEDAARRLGWTPGSVKGGLERGRKRLHARFVRRGLTLAIALATAEVARGSAVGLPASLAATTVKAALAFGSAKAEVSVMAARLAGEVLAGAGATKAKVMLALLFVLGLTALGATALTQQTPGHRPLLQKPPAEPALPKVAAKGHVDHEGFPLPAEAIARVGSLRLRGGAIGYVDDDKIIVSAADGKTLQFWDAATGKLRRTVSADLKGVDCTVSADGKVLHLVSSTSYVALDSHTGKELRRLALPEDLQPVSHALVSNGTLVVLTSSRKLVRIIDLSSGEERPSWQLDGAAYAFALSADGKTLALSGGDGTIRLHDFPSGASRSALKTSLKSIRLIRITPDGSTLLAAGQNFEETPAVILDIKTGKERSRLTEADSSPFSAAFTPDGRHVAIGGQQPDAGLYEVATGKKVQRFRAWTCFGLTFSRDGKTLLATNAYRAITQWDVATGALLPASADPTLGLMPLRFVDGGKHLLVGRDASGYDVYDWKAGREVQRSVRTEQTHSALAPDRWFVASVLKDGKSIGLIDAKTGKVNRTLIGGEEFINHVGFSPNGKQIVSSEWGGAVRIWDVATGKQHHHLTDHPVAARVLVFSPDGRWLATACSPSFPESDAIIRIWDTATGKLVRRITPAWKSLYAITFSPSGAVLAASGSVPAKPFDRGEVSLFDVSSGAVIKTLVSQQGLVDGLAYSGDERTLATASQQGLCLWEIATGAERHRFDGHIGSVFAAVFSPDNSLLAACSDDAPLFIWDVYGKHGPALPEQWSAADRKRLSDHLAGVDAKAAFQAIRRLICNPVPAIALLREQLKPAEATDGKRLKQWLQDLDSDDFELRQTAFTALEKLDDRIEMPLQESLKGGLSLEARRRVQSLLEKFDAPSPEHLARWRALEVIEQIATPEAVRLLEMLAAGERDARLTREAAAAIERVRKR